MEKILFQIGAWAGFFLPFFNIPLIMRMVKRKSSHDLSLTWVFGVWTCTLLMFPLAFLSDDLAMKLFSVTNFTLFSTVVFFTVKYRRPS